MERQRQTRSRELLTEKLEKFKKSYGDSATLFSLESSLTQDDAVDLYKRFDDFLLSSKKRASLVSGFELVNVITEVIHYFNVALDLLPALSCKSGDLSSFVKKSLELGMGGGGGQWSSYSLQFGLPAGVSLALHFDTDA